MEVYLKEGKNPIRGMNAIVDIGKGKVIVGINSDGVTAGIAVFLRNVTGIKIGNKLFVLAQEKRDES